MMQFLDLIIILVALCAAPYMLAGMFRLPQPPSPRVVFAVIGPPILGVLGLLVYLVKRIIAYQWQPEPHEVHRWLQADQVSRVSGAADAEDGAQTQTDTQTDLVFALMSAFEGKEVDRTRQLIIDSAATYGWGVGQVRTLIKGDSGAVGAELAAARTRLGIGAPVRMLPVSDHEGRREIVM